MSVSAALSKDDPLMVAWNAYKETTDFDNAKRWAQCVNISNTRDDTASLRVQHPHLEGSLWAMFVAGWNAGRAPTVEGKQA